MRELLPRRKDVFLYKDTILKQPTPFQTVVLHVVWRNSLDVGFVLLGLEGEQWREGVKGGLQT